jgi:hypothetical protein
VIPPWQARDNVAQFVTQVQKLKPLLDRIDTGIMVQEGGPASYADALRSTKAQLDYVLTVAARLQAQPDALSVAMEAYFRVEGQEGMIRSLVDGVRKYQSPDLAAMLQGAVTDTANGREKLKQYMVELAVSRETEFRIMDEEAQRCRQRILQTPAPSRPRTPKKGDAQ